MMYSVAENILRNVGVEHPNDIDLDLIASIMGVKVRYLPLDGCEARIVGNGDKAIAAINSRSSKERQRFSLGHELGHWQFHRNRILLCQASDIGGYGSKSNPSEKVADQFAADLLMPRFLFDPALRQHQKLSFKTIRLLSAEFGCSLTATAIRVVQSGWWSAILVCHNRDRRQWFRRSPDIPERWFPQDMLEADSPAFDVLFNHKPDDLLPQRIPADAWFDRSEAKYYEIREQSVHVGFGQILTILLIDEPGMLEER